MHKPHQSEEGVALPFVSTGHLPGPAEVQSLLAEAHARFKSNTEGETSQVYPALARVPSDLFGICVVGTSGRFYAVGDTNHEFTINERVETVCVRAGLSGKGPGPGS